MTATLLSRAPVASDRIRVVTAASLFDGHDAAINIMRRILQARGAEVVHLGHDRSVDEIVEAAIEEDAQAVAISSYQGGHMEFFAYLVDSLRRLGGATSGCTEVAGGRSLRTRSRLSMPTVSLGSSARRMDARWVSKE